jgi:hypothetical protein
MIRYDEIDDEETMNRLDEYYYYIYSSQMYELLWGNEQHRRSTIEEMYNDEQNGGVLYSVEAEKTKEREREAREWQAASDRKIENAITLLTSNGYAVNKLKS